MSSPPREKRVRVHIESKITPILDHTILDGLINVIDLMVSSDVFAVRGEE